MSDVMRERASGEGERKLVMNREGKMRESKQ